MEHEMFSLQGSVYCSFPLQVSYGIIFHWTTSKEEKCRKLLCFFSGPVGLTFSSLRNFCTRYKPPGLTNAVRGGDEVKICKNCWNAATMEEKNEKTFESTKKHFFTKFLGSKVLQSIWCKFLAHCDRRKMETEGQTALEYCSVVFPANPIRFSYPSSGLSPKFHQ